MNTFIIFYIDKARIAPAPHAHLNAADPGGGDAALVQQIAPGGVPGVNAVAANRHTVVVGKIAIGIHRRGEQDHDIAAGSPETAGMVVGGASRWDRQFGGGRTVVGGDPLCPGKGAVRDAIVITGGSFSRPVIFSPPALLRRGVCEAAYETTIAARVIGALYEA